MKTLEALFSKKAKMKNGTKYYPDFRVAVQGKKEGGIHVLIHPFKQNGDTLEFIVKENKLTPFVGKR